MQVNTDHIRGVIDGFDLQTGNSCDIINRLLFFNGAITNLKNFIPNENILCDDRDLEWIIASKLSFS